MGSQNWLFGDPRPLHIQTIPNPSFLQGPVILWEQSATLHHMQLATFFSSEPSLGQFFISIFGTRGRQDCLILVVEIPEQQPGQRRTNHLSLKIGMLQKVP